VTGAPKAATRRRAPAAIHLSSQGHTHLSNQGDTSLSSQRAIHHNRVFHLSSRVPVAISQRVPMHHSRLDIRLSSQVAMGPKGRRLAALALLAHPRRRAR
jgi:hypothetical protein